jgi:hypothetical protein
MNRLFFFRLEGELPGKRRPRTGWKIVDSRLKAQVFSDKLQQH